MSKLLKSLEQLATMHASLSEDREAILALLNPKARRAVSNLDWASAARQLGEWLVQLVNTEPPPKSIRGLHFGLFETAEGFTLYVTGADSYDRNDPDWACANDWWPEGRYVNIALFAELGIALRGSGEATWEVAQAIAIALVKAFFTEHARQFQEASGLTQVCVASGFDDGDVYEVRTALAATKV